MFNNSDYNQPTETPAYEEEKLENLTDETNDDTQSTEQFVADAVGRLEESLGDRSLDERVTVVRAVRDHLTKETLRGLLDEQKWLERNKERINAALLARVLAERADVSELVDSRRSDVIDELRAEDREKTEPARRSLTEESSDVTGEEVAS